MAKAWLPESIRVGARPCTTNSWCVPVELGLRRRRTAHTRGCRRARRVRASCIGVAGTDRMVAVEVMTFSAGGLRTEGDRSTLAEPAGCQRYGQPPAAWLLSRERGARLS